MSQKNTKVTLSPSKLSYAGKYLNVDLSKMTATLSTKLQGAVKDDTVSFSFSPFECKITISFTKSVGKGKTSCDGTLTISIKPGNNPKPKPQLQPHLQPVFNPQAVQKASETVAAGGAIAIGAVVLFKLLKGAVGCAAGPAGCLVGLAL